MLYSFKAGAGTKIGQTLYLPRFDGDDTRILHQASDDTQQLEEADWMNVTEGTGSKYIVSGEISGTYYVEATTLNALPAGNPHAPYPSGEAGLKLFVLDFMQIVRDGGIGTLTEKWFQNGTLYQLGAITGGTVDARLGGDPQITYLAGGTLCSIQFIFETLGPWTLTDGSTVPMI